jgi:hypothetical protein
MGNTGTGKSTLVNYLLGLDMEYNSQNRTVQVSNPSEEVTKIGHNIATSETFLSKVCEKESCPVAFVDCGGLFDTRGAGKRFVIAVSSTKCFKESTKGIKLAICVDAILPSVNRGTHFYDTVHVALEKLFRNYKEYPHSILLMFTKPTRDISGAMFNAQQAKEMITALMNDCEGSQKELYQFLLREEGKYICVGNPLDKEGRSAILSLLTDMAPIANPKETIQLSCSADTDVELFQEITQVAHRANELFTVRRNLLSKIQADITSVQSLRQQEGGAVANINSINTSIQPIEQYLQSHALATTEANIQSHASQSDSHQSQIISLDSQIGALNTTAPIYYTSQSGGPWTISGV